MRNLFKVSLLVSGTDKKEAAKCLFMSMKPE